MANRFLSNITINDSYTLPSADGANGQVIGTDGAGNLSFVDQTTEALTLNITVKNKSGGSLAKGTIVHAHPSANPPNGNLVEVIAADYDTSASMPAIGVLNETLADEAEGQAIMFGAVSGIDTSSFSAGDELWVGDNGAFTNTKPATAGQLIQKIAVVIKSHASNGLIKIFGAGRTNDVPLPLYIDDANQRVGISTDLPSEKLEVNGNILADSFIKSGGISSEFLKADGSVDSNSYALSSIDLQDVTDNGATTDNPITITSDSALLNLRSVTSGNGTSITFSDNATGSYGQQGFIKHFIVDGDSYGSGTAFVIGSTEPTTTILADGKLMYAEGIYSKPATGTGGGTRKDINWDSAYNFTSTFDITDFTDPKFLRSDVDDSATGIITFENGIRVGTGSHGTSANRASITFGEGTPTSDSMYIEYDGEGLSNDNNSLYIGRTDTASDLARFTYGGDIELTSNNWSIVAGGTFSTTGSAAIGLVTPSNTLHVYKNATIGPITDTTTANAGLRIQDSGASMYFDGNSIVLDNTGYITTNGGHDLVLGTNSSPRIHIDSAGYIGINETNPQSQLHVVGSTLIDSGSLIVSSAGYTQIQVDQTDSAAVTMGVSSGSTEGFLNVINSGANHLTTAPELKFLLNSTRYATLTTTGFGLGTPSPTANLDIEGSVNGEDILLRLNNTFDDNNAASNPITTMWMNAASNNGYLRLYGAPANTASKHRFDIGSTAGSSFMTFSPSGSEKVRITSGGLVGIGTDNPQAILHTQGSGEQWAFIETTDGNVGGIRLQTSTGSRQNVLYRNATDNLVTLRAGTDDGEIAFISGGSASETMRIDSSQRLLVGKTGSNYGTQGVEIRPSEVLITRDGGAALSLNRLSSDGTILSLAQATSTVANFNTSGTGLVLDMVEGGNSFTFYGSGAIGMQEDHYINLRFDIDDNNNNVQYILLCRNEGGNDVNGTIRMDRTSGLRHACSVDIIVSAGSSLSPVGGLRAHGVAGNGEPEYRLVTCTSAADSQSYIALEISNPDTYYETSGAYFTGRIVSTGSKLVPRLASEVSSVVNFESNSEHSVQGNFVVKDGRLGVGVGNPSQDLHVVGSALFGETLDVTHAAPVKIRNSDDGFIGMVRTSVRTWAHNIYSDGHYSIRNVDGSSNVLTLTDDNRVGLQNDNPSYDLDVLGNARIGGNREGTQLIIQASNTDGASAATATIKMIGYEGRAIGTFYNDVSYDGEWFAGMRYNGQFDNYVIGFDETGGQSEYDANSLLRVQSDGIIYIPEKLGVGTAGPQARLHVIAPSTANGEILQEWSYANSYEDTYSLMLKQTVTSGVVRYNFSMVNNDTDYNDVLILDRGKVGIKNVNPSEALDVVGSIRAYQGAGNSATIKLNVSTAGSPQIDFSDYAGDQYWAVGADDADNFFKIHGSTTSMPTINSISTGAFLTINQSGTLTMTGDVVAYSDERLKENVKTIDGALDKVLSMRGVYYNRTDLEDKRRKVGVIAQEVEKVLPEVVSQYSKEDDTRAVDYGKMVGVLIEAMKEQQKQIEELKAIINKK